MSSVSFIEINKQTGGSRGREHFYNGKRDKFSGKSDQIREFSDERGNHVEKPGCPEDSRCSHQSDQSRDKPDDGTAAIFCTGDKGFIDINFCSQSTDDDGKDQKWDKVVGDVEKNVQGVSSFYYGAISRYICISFEDM